jgi:hypothetical protein
MSNRRRLRGEGVATEDEEEVDSARRLAFGDWKRKGLFMTNLLTMFMMAFPEGLIKPVAESLLVEWTRVGVEGTLDATVEPN